MRILVLSTIGVSHNAIENFKYKDKIVGIIGVNPNSSVVPQISGYSDVSRVGEKLGIPYFYVTKYSLQSQEDKDLFEGIEYDLIWVSGWQRLIPDWLITSASYGAIGGHGSADGITKGRGRSPQNWALLMGRTKFHIALFKITPFTDNGDIILEKSFDLTEHDDILSSYKKSSLCIIQMITEIVENPQLLSKAQKQDDQNAEYYPQRLRLDGAIDWNLSQEEISRQCRALTHPYPGLYSQHREGKISIFRCQPFDSIKEQRAGFISHIFQDKSFLVNCGDGRILITEYEYAGVRDIRAGDELNSVDYCQTLSQIIDRHYQKHPDQPINQNLLKFIKSYG